MSKAARIYKWILISIVAQTAILAYVNFVYLPNRGAVKATMYESGEDAIESKSMKLPADARNIAVSYNGLFAAYTQGGDLVVTDVKNKKKLKSLSSSNGTFSYYKWLPDRDMLIYSVKSPGGKQGQVQILTYDIGPKVERDYPKITGLPKESEVVDIELSPLTNVVYTLIKTGASRTKVYRYNIMDNLNFIMNADVGTILKETAYSDNLVYRNSDGKIFVRSGKNGSSRSLTFKNKVALLGIDSEDNLYAGELNPDKKVVNIYSGKLEQQVKDWKQSKLSTPALPSDLFVTPGGAVYSAARQEKRVYAVGNGSGIAYEGELLEILDDYIVSRNNNDLELTAISK